MGDTYDRSDARPLTWSEIRDGAESIEATEEVPEELRTLYSDLSRSHEIGLKTIRRGEGAPDPTPGHRPAWVTSAFKPRAAPRLSRPRLHYRDVPVDPLIVWGFDDRSTYNDTSFPWGCVCRILTNGGMGSGVLVGPRHVLTASHVVDWNRGATIEVHRAGSTVAATAQAVAGWAFTQITDPGGTTVDEDYAVLVTDQRLGDRFGWMGTRTYDSAWDDEDFWMSIGYAGDVANSLFPVFQRDMELDEDEFDYGSARAMTTAADLMSGQSGSPMFSRFTDGHVYVVAVVSGVGNVFLSGDENWCAGGSDLPRLVNQARAGDP